MKKELSLVLIGILVLSIYVPVAAPEADSEMVNVIIETDDATALTGAIVAAGGSVTVEFVTVPMIAAEIPLLTLGDVLENPHCLQAWKDRIQYLPSVPEVSEGDNFAATEVLDTSGFTVESYEIEDLEALPENFYNYIVTGAEDVWYETGYGAGSLVAVIDTGTYPGHPLFMWPDGTSSVIGGACFTDDCADYPWDSPYNHYHGTFCAGIIASHGAILLPKSDWLAQSIMMWAPDSYIDYGTDILVPLLGMAPMAEIYAIKVFPHDGSGVPSSVIMQGIDHAIQMRKLYDATGGAEGYPIDVISMSLGGATGYDGNDPEDRLVDEATKAGIVVSTAAGNDGPAFNTVSTPGTSNTSISVGAAVDGPHTRVGWDIIYGMAGVGGYFYPYDDIQIIYFSAHGPTSDGRLAPDVLACGVYAFGPFPPYYIGTMSGTSASCPAVSGAAALLAAWQKAYEGAANPYQIRNAIIEGAVPLTLPYSEFAQGNGYINLPNSLALLQGGIDGGLHIASGYSFDVTDLHGGSQTWSTGDIGPGLTFDIPIAIDKDTQQIDVCLSNVTINGPQNPVMGDSIEFYIQTAVRTSEDFYYYSINLTSDYCFTVTDPMPGNMRIVVEGDWTNWGTVSCDVTVTETEGKENNGGHKETIGNDEWHAYYIDVPADLGAVVFELWWMHDWSKFPTYDIDMYVIDPDGYLYLDGATLWSPEKQFITDPTPGTYLVLIYGYEIYQGRDPYMLNVFYIV